MRGVLGSLTVLALMAGGLFGGGMMMREQAGATEAPAPDAFARAMTDSMARMHAAMDVPPSGYPDRDFAAMMIPHHQGAIDMARLELAHGKDPVLRRLAQGILVEQAQEIEVMRRALADLPPPPARPAAQGHHHHGDDHR